MWTFWETARLGISHFSLWIKPYPISSFIFSKVKKKKKQKNKKLLDLEIYYMINILVENINFSDFWF